MCKGKHAQSSENAHGLGKHAHAAQTRARPREKCTAQAQGTHSPGQGNAHGLGKHAQANAQPEGTCVDDEDFFNMAMKIKQKQDFKADAFCYLALFAGAWFFLWKKGPVH